MKGKVFTAQEVQSIRNGSKVMFREFCKKQPQGGMEKPYVIRDMGIGAFHYPFGKPPYQVGQEIFVKEKYVKGFSAIYYAENAIELSKHNTLYSLNPAQHMKQEHSRLTLRIKSVEVERFQEISEEDCYKEGFEPDYQDYFGEDIRDPLAESDYKEMRDFRKNFIKNWNATHKKPEEKFEASPWVWKIEFEVVKNN